MMQPWLLLLIGLMASAAFTPGLAGGQGNAADEEKGIVHLVSHGWHAGIVLRREDLDPANWPVLADFPGAEYLEIGWGDLEFYRTPQPGKGLMLRAALVPTDSVLHLVGFRGPVADYFPRSEVVRVELRANSLKRLSLAIAESFHLDEQNRPLYLGSGLYGNGRFYRSGDIYHLFNTCNVWVARKLRAAGLEVSPARAIRVEDLFEQLRQLDEVRPLSVR